MNILFLTLAYPEGEEASNLYIDLMKDLKSKGNSVYVITACERKNNKETSFTTQQGVNVLRVKTGNIQKTNLIEKGISTLLIEKQFIRAIKKFIPNIKFDLVIYSTPPITFSKVIKMIKDRDGAKSYLLLKDIFPQNAVDMGMMKEGSLLHKLFRNKEEKLYKNSDYIGCMSEANKKYVINHNNFINPSIVEVCPNSISPKEIQRVNDIDKKLLKEKLGIPGESLLIIYGGNLGKPQGIDFLIDIARSNKENNKVFFMVVGNGTEYSSLKEFVDIEKPKNFILKEHLAKKEYEELVKISDVGLILLDKRFTIPNFPSRLLSYMEYSLPVIAATDIYTDIKECLEYGNFGMWCESGDLDSFNKIINKFIENSELLEEMSSNSRKYLEEKYTVNISSRIILKHFI